jgi:hypothetical protein
MRDGQHSAGGAFAVGGHLELSSRCARRQTGIVTAMQARAETPAAGMGSRSSP